MAVTSGNEKKTTRLKSTRTTRTKAQKALAELETRPRRPSGRRKWPWEQIRVAYVEGVSEGELEWERRYPTLKDLSDEFGCSYNMIRERCTKERWTELRTAIQVELAQKRQRERTKKLAGEAVEFDERSLGVSKVGLAMVQARLNEIAKDYPALSALRNEAMERRKNGIKVENWELYSPVNYRELDGLSRAAAMFQEIGRKALGTDVERVEVTGAAGGPIETAISVSKELMRDDPERLTALLAAAERAGLMNEVLEGEEIVDAEVVDEPAPSEEEPPAIEAGTATPATDSLGWDS